MWTLTLTLAQASSSMNFKVPRPRLSLNFVPLNLIAKRGREHERWEVAILEQAVLGTGFKTCSVYLEAQGKVEVLRPRYLCCPQISARMKPRMTPIDRLRFEKNGKTSPGVDIFQSKIHQKKSTEKFRPVWYGGFT